MSEGRAHAALQAIDSLLWHQPDSALLALMVYEGDSSEYNHHYAQLLTSELLYKNYYEQTNRCELQQAVAYFDSLVCQAPPLQRGLGGFKTRPNQIDPMAFLAARAHYINGVGYYERDSVIDACREYLKALEVMEGHFEEKNMEGKNANFMALTYTHLARLFSDHYLHDQAIYFGKKSLEYYKKYEAPPRHVAWMLNETGSQYEMKELFDSACFYYQSGIKVLPDTNNLTYRDLATLLTFCLYKKSVPMSSSLAKLYYLLEQAESEKERLSRCLTLGAFYYYEKQYDSAIVYLDRVFLGSTSMNAKKQAAEWLVEICKAQGSTSEIMEYADFLVPFANLNENQGALKSQLTELCHNYEESRQENLHQKKVKKLMGWGGLVLAIMAILATIMVISYFVNKKQRGHLKAQKEETEEKLRTTIHEHIKELEEKDLALDMAITEERQKAEKSLKAKEIQHSAVLGKAKNTIRHLQEINRMLNERKGQENMETEQPKALMEEYDALMREGLCINIKQRLKKADAYTSFDAKDYSSLALSSKELSELIQIIDKHCPDFSRRLKKQYPELSSNDIQLCRLYLLNLKVLQVAILFGTDYSSIRKRTNRLKGKIGSEELYLQLKSTFFEEN